MTRRIALVLAGVIAGIAATAQAHHSWSVDYDTEQRITVAGTVTEFLRRRPHPAFAMDVQQPDGETVQWTVEFSGGFRDSAGNEYGPDYFPPGEAITVTGQPHRDTDRNFVRLRSVVRDADGEQFERNRRRGRGGRR